MDKKAADLNEIPVKLSLWKLNIARPHLRLLAVKSKNTQRGYFIAVPSPGLEY
jgi:hypothetical protein